MIKIRNKRIALLLVLAMLATMFVGVGTTSAATTQYVSVSRSGDTAWIDADDGQEMGYVGVKSTSDWATLTSADTMKVKFVLPDGVCFSNGDDTKTAPYPVNPATAINETPGGYTIDVDSDVTGTIYAKVTVSFYDGSDLIFEEDAVSVQVAKINVEDLSLSAKKAKTVIVGDEQKGAPITIKETSPGIWSGDWENNKIKFAILTSGVTWDRFAGDDYNQFDVTAGDIEDLDRASNTVLYAYVDSDTETQSTKVIFTPMFTVKPGTTGDILIKVSGDNIVSQTFTVAKVGTSGVDVTVVDGDEDFIYRGQAATFDDVTVKLNPGIDWDDQYWFSITLPKGVKFQKQDYGFQPVGMQSSITGGQIRFQEVYNKGQSVWFTINDFDDKDVTLKLSDFALVADYNAEVGDLAITFDGSVEGTYKIGSIKTAFTVSTTPFQLQSGLTSIDAANIVITETEEGALRPTDGVKYYGYDSGHGPSGWIYIPRDRDSEDGFYVDFYLNEYYGNDYLDIVLPAGVTFSSTPAVEVTSGDLELGDVAVVDNNKLRIRIDEASNLLSTITVSNLDYSALNQPALGDLVAKVGAEYNVASNNPLEALTIGAVATNPTAVYVIGAPTFTVNGAVNNVVTPSYIKNARTYLAIRDIGTGLGIDPMNILWDAVGQKVTLIKGTKIVQVTIGSNVMVVNGIAVAMDVAPEISNGRTMLPAAFIAQAFGATASWDALTQTVTIK